MPNQCYTRVNNGVLSITRNSGILECPCLWGISIPLSVSLPFMLR